MIPPRSPSPPSEGLRGPTPSSPEPPVGPPQLSECLSTLCSTLDGLHWVCLFDDARRASVAAEGIYPLQAERTVLSTSRLVRAARSMVRGLGHSGGLEDLVVSTEHEYHLVRPVRSLRSLAFHLVLDRARTNLSVSRVVLAEIERTLRGA